MKPALYDVYTVHLENKGTSEYGYFETKKRVLLFPGYLAYKKGMIDSDRGQERMKRVAAYIKIAEDHNLSPSKLAIAWCLLNENVSTVILGASSLNQLQDNLDSLDCVEALKDESLVKALNNIGS